MKFDTKIFLEKLQPYKTDKKENIKPSPVVKVLSYLWHHTNTADIDFSSFSVNDVLEAMDDVEQLPYDWNDSGESFVMDPHNAFVLVMKLSDLRWGFANTTNKKYIEEEEDLFL